YWGGDTAQTEPERITATTREKPSAESRKGPGQGAVAQECLIPDVAAAIPRRSFAGAQCLLGCRWRKSAGRHGDRHWQKRSPRKAHLRHCGAVSAVSSARARARARAAPTKSQASVSAVARGAVGHHQRGTPASLLVRADHLRQHPERVALAAAARPARSPARG